MQKENRMSKFQKCKVKKDSQRRGVRISGTKEWAVENVNVVRGCEHRCRYCFARRRARDLKRIHSFDEWGTTYNQERPAEVKKGRKNYGGTVMFPTTHDITPQFLEPCVQVLHQLLDAGNRVLIVTKPHLDCTQRLCREFSTFKSQILFRFTIGAMNDAVLSFWDTHAPSFTERFKCLKHAHQKGFETSVSVEPMLDPPNVVQLFHRLEPYVTHSIWLGKMNQIHNRVQPSDAAERQACDRLEGQQSDENIRGIFAQLKDEPLVRWKDSIKQVMGLVPAEQAGMDQ
jgi:DNA repair photolyase